MTLYRVNINLNIHAWLVAWDAALSRAVLRLLSPAIMPIDTPGKDGGPVSWHFTGSCGGRVLDIPDTGQMNWWVCPLCVPQSLLCSCFPALALRWYEPRGSIRHRHHICNACMLNYVDLEFGRTRHKKYKKDNNITEIDSISTKQMDSNNLEYFFVQTTLNIGSEKNNFNMTTLHSVDPTLQGCKSVYG